MPYALIMGGGVGQRLWPRSRASTPKQTLAVGDERPLVRQAFDRLLQELDITEILLITTADQADSMAAILPELPPENLLIEPVGRNTAPCVGYGATVIRDRDPDAVMVVVSADHVIRPPEAFADAMLAGCMAVEENPEALVSIGVVPRSASSQLGHVRRGARVASHRGVDVFEALEFIEKPPVPEAQRLTDSGEVYWNTGIFVWKAARILAELAEHRPALAAGLECIGKALGTDQEQQTVRDLYPEFEKVAIDYAVMEHAQRILVVEGRFEWDDVGTWDSLARVYEDDGAGNIVLGPHVGLETRNCVIACNPDQVVGTIGVKDLVIVQTPDALLVCPRSRAGEVRELVDRLRTEGLEKHL